MNIVIVDDDKKILEMLERAFVMETDYKIISTTNPIEAYDIVTKQKIDLVITDIQMPEMNGLDL
ncbi:MAG TPA: response regulator, partial [bacterium]|nr:response regulator [bacterium]